MAATLLAVSATVAPDSLHEHGLQVTAVSDVPEEVHMGRSPQVHRLVAIDQPLNPRTPGMSRGARICQ